MHKWKIRWVTKFGPVKASFLKILSHFRVAVCDSSQFEWCLEETHVGLSGGLFGSHIFGEQPGNDSKIFDVNVLLFSKLLQHKLRPHSDCFVLLEFESGVVFHLVEVSELLGESWHRVECIADVSVQFAIQSFVRIIRVNIMPISNGPTVVTRSPNVESSTRRKVVVPYVVIALCERSVEFLWEFLY